MTALLPDRRGVALGRAGLLVRRRAVLATVGVVVILLAGTAYGLLAGTLDLSAARVWTALTGGGSSIDHLVVVDRRLSRCLAAVGVGFALGISGALTQTVTRNPIATPDLLGVTAGASVAAVAVITMPQLRGLVTDGGAATVLAPAALIGGLLTTALVVGLSWRGGFDGLRLILVGIGVNAVMLGLVSWMLVLTEVEEASVAQHWLVGSLASVRMDDLTVLWPVLALAVAACLVLSRDLGALRLGRDVASSLGTPAARTELYAVGVAVVTVSMATAIAGPIAFVAFVAPQAAMRVFGTAGPPPLASGLIGSVVVLMSDQVAQRLPVTLPVGVVTAVVGAPVLLLLLIRYVRRASV